MDRMIVRMFVSAFAFFLACAGCQQKKDRPLVVGMELKYPPFEMTDAQGQPAGISVEIAHALGAHLGRAIRIENMPFDGLLPSLKTGKIDLIISSMTATEERAKSIDFSEPYLRTGLALLVAKNSPVQGIADLNAAHRTVAVKQGTTGHLYAEANLKKGNVLVLADETSAVLEVVQGKADAFIYDQMSVYQNWKKYAGQTRAMLTPFKAEGWAIGFRKGDDALRGKVNAFLKAFRAGGGFERLGDKYLAEQKKAFAEMGAPFFF